MILARCATLLGVALLSACGEKTHDAKAEGDPPAPPAAVAAPVPPRLPASVVPRSDEVADFGIDVSSLSDRDAQIVRSAWKDYVAILSGKEPACPVEFVVSDGGSAMYDCGAYRIMRIKTIASRDGVDGYEYGPKLDFGNGHEVERLQFHSQDELRALEDAPATGPAGAPTQ
jgi:hypothetical protein